MITNTPPDTIELTRDEMAEWADAQFAAGMRYGFGAGLLTAAMLFAAGLALASSFGLLPGVVGP